MSRPKYDTENFAERFGANIKQKRTDVKMSQGELAKKTGYTGAQNPAATICKIESGKMDISVKKASMIADALGVTVEELIPKKGDTTR